MTLHQPGMTASHPTTSCSGIFNFNPQTPSGYYWLEASDGSAIRLYCNMTLSCKGVGRGWMQVAKLDMTNSSHQCPPGTTQRTYTYQSGSKRLCGWGITTAGCSSTTLSTHGIKYNQVCGKVIAYQAEVQMHLEDSNFLSTVTVLMESASPMDATQGNTLGHLQLLLMNLVTLLPTVPVQIFIKLHLNCQHLLEMITFATQGALITSSTSFMVTIHYGMELVVDQPTPAAL